MNDNFQIHKQWWFWLTIILIIGFWGLNWFLVGCYLDSQEGGQFGDRFGATTSLFGGLTIAGLIITIILQQKQIAIQQSEITAQLKEQTKDRELSIFFEMMHLQNSGLESVTWQVDTSRRALKVFNSHLKSRVLEPNVTHLNNVNQYQNFLDGNKENYLHYIKSLQATFAFVVFSKVFTDDEKKTLIAIFRSQLSASELSLWAYDLYLTIHTEQLKKATRDYEIFKSLTKNMVGNERHVEFFLRGENPEA
jgi:hypothetical protein